jgi:hypothetical protein
MITIIICAVIGIVLCYLLLSFGTGCLDWKDKIMLCFSSCFLGGFCGIVLGFLIALVLPMKTHEVVDTYKVITLKDNQSVSGKFALGTGYTIKIVESASKEKEK